MFLNIATRFCVPSNIYTTKISGGNPMYIRTEASVNRGINESGFVSVSINENKNIQTLDGRCGHRRI